MRCRRNVQYCTGSSLADATSFVRKKKESTVFLYRTTDSAAKLVLIPLRPGGIEVALRIQNRIAEVLEEVAMKVVGSGFCDYVHDRTRIPAVFGVERIGNDAEFFDAIRRRLDGGKVHELVIGIAAVYAEVIRTGAAAVH